jgi:hypothetical protein
MIHNKFRYILTLVALFAISTGAWATDEVLLTTITPTSLTTYSQSPDGSVTVTLDNIGSYNADYGWLHSGSVTVEASQGYTITRCVFKQYPYNSDRVLVDNQAPFTATIVSKPGGDLPYVSAVTSTGDVIGGGHMDGISSIEVYGTAESPLEVTWDKTTKQATFAMPAYDVEIAPIYAPTAMFATDGNLVLAPTAIEGVFAESTDAIVTAGTVVEGQGTAMYFATTDAKMTAEKAATADGWLSILPTAAGYDDATTVYVWYYIKGADTPDGQDPTAENTFNDSEICATPLTVTVLSNKFDIAFKAANANTIEAGKATVKVGETAAEVKEGKLTGVKMGSKVTITAKEGYKFRKVEGKDAAAAKTIIIGDVELTYADGDTWETIVSKNSDKIKRIAGGYIVQVAQPAPNQYRYIKVVLSNKVNPSDIIDPSKNYEWDTIEVYS